MNGDGYADLAIGVPFERVINSNSAGAVITLYGSASGLQAPASGALVSQLWTQASTANFGPVEGGDQFGSALASGDFNGDGFKDLAIGAPGEDLTPIDAGVVDVIYGTAAGLSVTTGTAPIAISQAAAGDAVARDSAIAKIEDPVSRLVAAGASMRAAQLTPAGVNPLLSLLVTYALVTVLFGALLVGSVALSLIGAVVAEFVAGTGGGALPAGPVRTSWSMC